MSVLPGGRVVQEAAHGVESGGAEEARRALARLHDRLRGGIVGAVVAHGAGHTGGRVLAAGQELAADEKRKFSKIKRRNNRKTPFLKLF